MTKITIKSLLISLCIASLVASGGGDTPPVGGGDTPGGDTPGGDTPGGGTPLNGTDYTTFGGNLSKTSKVLGISTLTHEKDSGLVLVESSGTLKHDTRAITYTKDTIGISTTANKGFDKTYEFVSTYEQSYSVNTEAFSANGVVGVVTEKFDMPNKGANTYSGEANGLIVTKAHNLDINKGVSKVDVNFATSKVNVEISGFTTTNQLTGAVATSPIDKITVTGMQLVDSGFKGGSFSTLKGATPVNLTGANKTSGAAGGFYGYEETNKAPDEVAGMIFEQGTEGSIVTTFIAD